MKGYIISVITGFILIGCGIGFLAFEVMDYDYVDGLPTTVMKATKTYSYDLNDKDLYIGGKTENATIISDESIALGTAKVEVVFYGQVTNLTSNKRNVNGGTEIRYDIEYKVNSLKYFYNFTVTGLKDKKVYNYDMFDDYSVTVYVNPVDVDKIKGYENILEVSDFYIQDETIVCPLMLEEIARDSETIYYLNCLKSGTVFLIYDNGFKISVKKALLTNKVDIHELIEAGLDVYQEPINNNL